jgi:hypothetical protein
VQVQSRRTLPRNAYQAKINTTSATCSRIATKNKQQDPQQVIRKKTKAFSSQQANAFVKTTANAFYNPPCKQAQGAKVAQTDEGWLDRQQRPSSSVAELDRSTSSSQQAPHHEQLHSALLERLGRTTMLAPCVANDENANHRKPSGTAGGNTHPWSTVPPLCEQKPAVSLVSVGAICEVSPNCTPLAGRQHGAKNKCTLLAPATICEKMHINLPTSWGQLHLHCLRRTGTRL